MYKITKGQLIASWLFGIASWFFLFDIVDNAYPTPMSGVFMMILIPFILTFYTIGWRKNNLPKKEE